MPRFAAKLAMLFTEVPFLDRFAAAARAGFGAVAFLFSYDVEASALAEALQAHGLHDALGSADRIGCEYKPRAVTEVGLDGLMPYGIAQTPMEIRLSRGASL